jgi:poly(hydroxyalkanoate) granule-associated protein
MRMAAACAFFITSTGESMVKKTQKNSADKKSAPQFSSAVKDSAQQIWLAGLGAFSKAQQEGSKVFDTLVKEGQTIQRKTHAAAEERFTEAASRMSDMANDIQSKVGNRWDKLESIFEDRVAKALGKLGVPSAKEVNDLATRVDRLDKAVQEMNRADAKPTAKRAAKSAAKSRPIATKAARPVARRAVKKTLSPVADISAGTASSASE